MTTTRCATLLGGFELLCWCVLSESCEEGYMYQ